jgi:prophage tail gpP-like protein
MLAMMRRAPRGLAATIVAAAAASIAALGCTPKASPTQCDALLDRYAQLVVTEELHDASADQLRAERERERSEARADDAFKNCSSEVSRAELDCAMRAPNASAFEKCLE